MNKRTPSQDRIEADTATELIGTSIEATMLASRAFSQGRGLKTPIRRKRRAITALFRGVVGRKPTDEELSAMLADAAGIV
jgi:hypothetical protein